MRTFVNARAPKFSPTIRGCFRDDDQWHMKYGTPDHPDPYPKFDLFDYNDVCQNAWDSLDRVRKGVDDPKRMPPPPDQPWSQTLIDLFAQWAAGGMPP